MRAPNLEKIVEAHVLVSVNSLDDYIGQMRQDILSPIREMQSKGDISWFCFLLHKQSISKDVWGSFHIRMEPSGTFVHRDLFIKTLPRHFLNPNPVTLSSISEINHELLLDGDWAHAWRIIGEISELVLSLLETHPSDIRASQILKFIHFFTNPWVIGGKCLYMPDGFIAF